ncbi:M28 family metallopeptidase [Aestuariivivens sediminicola]|uniref:M28 family metallopeptidase n=1 Tax=Aestuariivivens sediminicola TaxID=2913560 RepID=UPI001F572EE2|nr:M20/M25/M40 family metallo-hydrolase [Aestuariivivens sediminicola]
MDSKYILLGLCCLYYLNVFSQGEITVEELKAHIVFLSSDENLGRAPGGHPNRQVVRYIKNEFKAMGLRSFKRGFKQKFDAKIRVDKGMPEKEDKTCNVIGFVEGNDPVLKKEVILLGAHYDHLGLGGPSSKSDQRGVVYHGADDNASGTSALLEIAEYIMAQKDQLKRSVVFVAFGAEEQGLLGSRYFVEHPPVRLTQIKLMINMDMVGRMNADKHVYMNGAGTFPKGVEFMKSLGESLGVSPIVHAGSVGGSDHVSFYKKNISVLGMHTGAHPQYHTPEDTIEFINFEGQKLVCEYIAQAILRKATSDDAMYFIYQD